ncbi:MAG: hypothetical protein ACTSYB_15665, partial [Candidatus Helarchaeota archaeon]
ALLCIENATGNTSVQENIAYGDFTYGNRTMLKIYPGIDHGSEPMTPEIIRDTVLWMEGAFNLSNGNLSLEDMIQWDLNPYWNSFISIGFLLCIFPGISYICAYLLKPEEILHPKTTSTLNSKQKLLSLGIYTGIIAVASVATFPVLLALNYITWSPYNIAGFTVNILTIQCIFLILGLIAIFLIEKRYYKATWVDYGLNKSTLWKALLIGGLISVFLIFGYFILPYFTMSYYIKYPSNWGAYVLLFLNFLLVSFIVEIYFRGLIQTKLFQESSRFKNWLQLLIIALIGGLIQGLSVFLITFPLGNITITYNGFSFSIYLISFLGGFLIFSILGLLNGWIFFKTQHVISAAIVQAAILSWFLVTFMVPL